MFNLFFTTISTSKQFFSSERDQDSDKKEEQALYITFSQPDWVIAQNERFWLAVTTKKSNPKNSESSEATAKLNVYSRKYNFNCSVVANIQAELYSVCGKTYTLAFAMVQPWKKPFGKAKALGFEKTKGIAWHWREQRCVDFNVQRQISQSHGEISSNCGKTNIFHKTKQIFFII